MNNEDDYIRVLAVRQPWASLIIEGLKTIEVRSRNTNIRERVAIYASASRYTKKDEADIISNFYCMNDNRIIPYVLYKYASDNTLRGSRGVILGTVEIVDSVTMGKGALNLKRVDHLAPIDDGNYYGWCLQNPVKFVEPVKLEKWPSGGPWAKVPKSILPEIGESEMLKAFEEKRM